MSGLVSGVNYGLLFGPPQSSTDIETAMLNALFSNGNAGPSTAVSTGNPLTDLKLAQKNQTADVAAEAKVPQVARAITAFTTAVNSATSIQQALQNPAVMQVLLTASNLSLYINEPAVAQKALLSDPNDPNSLVNKLGNTTLLNTTKSFDFATKGLGALKNSSVMASLTQGYAEVMWRQSLDQATPGLANALTFLTQASSIKTVDDILGDSTNRAVVLGALGIPEQIAFQDLTAQEQAVSSRVTIAHFQNMTYVTILTDQYLLTMQQQANGGSSVVGLFSETATSLALFA
jgi:Protein of unknown function (DUF1217)